MKKIILIALISVAIAGSSAAQSPKGAERLRSTKRAPAPTSEVDGKFPILSSHIKSLGTIGRYEIASAKVRGLDTPNVTALLALDKETGQLAVLASGNSPGLGVAIVNGGANVGGSFLFGAKIRPDRTSVNNNSDADAEAESEGSYSRSEGGDAVSVSKSQGGSAVSISDADAKSSSTSSVRNENSNSSVNVNSNQQSQNQSSVNQNNNLNSNSNSSKNHNHNKAPKAPKKSRKH